MLLKALRDEIIVKPIYETEQDAIVIPESAQEYKQYHGAVYGEVISVGPKFSLRFERGCLVPGDKVIWQRHEGKRINYNNQKYLAVCSRWVMGRVDE